MKNNKIRRWVTVLCCLDIFSLSSCALEGRFKNRVLQISWWLFGNSLCSRHCQISAEFLLRTQTTSWDNQDPYQFVLCPLCKVFWILMIHVGWLEDGCYKLFPERFHHDSQDRIYNAIKVTCYQVAHADPLPTSLAILPRALSVCHKQALLQRSAAGISGIFLQAIKKSSVSPKRIIIFWYSPGRLCSQDLSLPRVFQKSTHHTRALNNVSSVMVIFIAMQIHPFLPVLFQNNSWVISFFNFSVFFFSSEHQTHL